MPQQLAFDPHVSVRIQPATQARAASTQDGEAFASLMEDTVASARPDRSRDRDHGRVSERKQPNKTESKPAPAKSEAKAEAKPDQETEEPQAEPAEEKAAAEPVKAEATDEDRPADGTAADDEQLAEALLTPLPMADTLKPVPVAAVIQAPLAADAPAAAMPVVEAATELKVVSANDPAVAAPTATAEGEQKPVGAGLTTPETAGEQKPAHADASTDAPAPATAEKPAPKSEAAVFDKMLAADPAAQQPASSLGVPNHAQRTADVQAAAAPALAPAASQPPPAPVVTLAALPVEIVARAHAGDSRFEIRLDPPELGRIDVRLDIDKGGQVTSRLVVERADTLDLLRRDAHQLERALQDAGLRTSDNGLQFSLRDQGFAGRGQQHEQSRPANGMFVAHDAPAPDAMPYRPSVRLGALDIRV